MEESLNKPISFKLEKGKDVWHAYFNIDNLEYIVELNNDNDSWDIVFLLKKNGRGMGFNLSGTGNALTIFATINANIIENGGIKILCLIRDISERKKNEKIKYIEEQKQKDKIRQNIMGLRNKLKKIKIGVH